MRDIKVGNFIRTNNGHIGELIRIERDDIDTSLKWYVFNDGKNERYVNKPYITNYSKNIIDLIEVGDIANKSEVYEIGQSENGQKWIHTSKGFLYHEEDLERVTILTHEQYEQNCYKVSDVRTQ